MTEQQAAGFVSLRCHPGRPGNPVIAAQRMLKEGAQAIGVLIRIGLPAKDDRITLTRAASGQNTAAPVMRKGMVRV